MLPKMQTIHEPETIEEALKLLKEQHTLPLYGGAELFDDTKAAGEVEAVVSLAKLGLDAISPQDGDSLVGAMTTLAVLAESTVLNADLCDAAKRSYPVNQRAGWTVGAVILYAPSSLPFMVTLLALDAKVTVAGAGETALADYLPTRKPTDLILSVRLPLETERVVWQRVSRTPSDTPIVCTAVRAVVEQGAVKTVRVALGGVAETPIYAHEVEAALHGKAATPEAIESAVAALDALEPPEDFIGSSAYRREMAKVVVRRALEEALQ